MSEAFGVALVKESILQQPDAGDQKFIRGVPKFVESVNTGLRYANDDDLMDNMKSCDQTVYHSFELPNGPNPTLHGEVAILNDINSEGIFSPDPGMALSPTTTSGKAQRDAMSVENKYKNEWYPEGFDHVKGTFLKRSLQTHSFNPNRTFSKNLHVQD